MLRAGIISTYLKLRLVVIRGFINIYPDQTAFRTSCKNQGPVTIPILRC